jgi:N-acetylmuramoyl-L-alanine amidase
MLTLLFTALVACTPPPPAPPPAEAAVVSLPAAPPPPDWPLEGVVLTPPELAFPPDFGVHRVMIDAGHGAVGNPGNTSAWCREEQVVMMELALHLGAALTATGHFEVEQGRGPDTTVAYPRRKKTAERLDVEALVSLHSDARGQTWPWEPEPGLECARNDDDPGFSILWSDESSSAELIQRRHRLARALAARMIATGMTAYDGEAYEDLYLGESDHPGVFVDRHSARRRIYMLRRPAVPSVIIETHHALDPAEATRWTEAATQQAFAAAVTMALVDALTAG